MQKPTRIAAIIADVYGKRYRLTQKPRRSELTFADGYVSVTVSDLWDQLKDFLKRHPVLSLMIVGFIGKMIVSLHYYNILVAQYANVMTADSNMHVLVQRRNDIGQNLVTAIHYYSSYEERVYKQIVEGRTDSIRTTAAQENSPDQAGQQPLTEEKSAALAALTKGLADGTGMVPSVTKLMAVAEQYPDLKSEINFSIMMSALVEVEKDLSSVRTKFNEEVNIYATTLKQFPSNLFAWEVGFDDYPYFDATQEAKEFKLHTIDE